MDEPFILTRDALKILAVDTRLDILKLLDERPHTLTEIKDALDLAPATVSEHLGKLEEAGLIEKRDEGRKWKYYRLTAEGAKLFSKRPAGGLMFAFVFSLVAAGGFAIASFIRSRARVEHVETAMRTAQAPQALMAPAAQTAAATAPTGPDWLLIAAVGFALVSVVVLTIILAKRLRSKA